MPLMKKKTTTKAKASSVRAATASALPKKVANVKASPHAKAVPVKASVEAKKSPIPRRDGTGHLDATYAADLHAKSLASAEDHTVDRAFLRRSKTLRAPLAEELGREAVMTMTSAEDQSDQLQDVVLDLAEEIGGPFVPTTGEQEFAPGSDRSNPRGATREAFPKT